MAQVDPLDDSIKRFIARHYRYDPERREWRHVIVGAFDNEREFRDCIDRTAAEIRARREGGEAVDRREHATGSVHEAGYLRRAANAHLLRRAMRHGVRELPLDEIDLPSNVAVFRFRQKRPPR